MTTSETYVKIETIFRREYGRAIAVLRRITGDFDAAEEAVAEAFTVALEQWPTSGVPVAPSGWIITCARNKAIDRMRRESSRLTRHASAQMIIDSNSEATAIENNGEEVVVRDDQLRLIFTCCHPALSSEAQVGLTLKLVGGLSTPEIARAFMASEATMAQRIVRAKAKIRAANIPYRVPLHAELPNRLRSVLAVVYLIYNEGYTASSGESLGRDDLCEEATRLGRLLVELMPDELEVRGLLALMLLISSRRRARTNSNGEVVLLGDQDRSKWDLDQITEGQAIVQSLIRANRPGPYQIQAVINAVHCDTYQGTEPDWPRIVALYDQLYAMAPSPVVALNRAVAISEVDGPESALRELDALPLTNYYLFHAIRADLLLRVGRKTEAIEELDVAALLTANVAERRMLQRRRAASLGTD